VPGK
jgi:hypothetical protein